MTEAAEATAQPNTDAVDNSTSAEAPTTEQMEGQQADQEAAEGATADGTETDAQADNGEGEGDGEKEQGNPLHGAPEAYEDFTIPDGMMINEGILERFSEFSKNADLSQDAAQQAVDLVADLQTENMKAILAAHQQQQEDWNTEIKQDKELGGARLEQTMATVVAAQKQFGDEQLNNILQPYDQDSNPDGMGLGNHPAVIRLFHRIGKAISPDNPGPDAGKALSPQEQLQALYPNTKL